MNPPQESGQRRDLAELAVVVTLVGLCAVLLIYAGSAAVERARGTEWFVQFAFIRQQTVEHFALTGEWDAPQVKELAGQNRTRCQASNEKVNCELRNAENEVRAAMTFRPASTEGAINWACERGADAGAADGSRWFAVCGQKIHSGIR